MKTKKILSILLTLCMLLSVVPMIGITASATTIDRTDWTKITGSTTIKEDGKYYLDSDITANIVVSDGITATIDLNGHTLTAGAGDCAIKINENNDYQAETYTDITIKDSSAEKTGKITTNGTAISHDGAGIFLNSGKLSLYDITITNCHTTGSGGAIYVGGLAQALLVRCTLTDNSASDSGGAIYKLPGATVPEANAKAPADKLALIDTVITCNTAGKNGGGVYAQISAKGSSCFTAGTMVTMANGSQKKVEEIVEGDLVKTFDHESGEFSTAKVYLSFAEQLSPQPIFTLHFDNGTEINCVASHTFLEKETRKYLEFNVYNAENYVGKSFFGEDGQWHKLTSVTYPGNTEWLYEIYTEKHQNSFANGMLSCPADADYLLNIYELDENLKADEAQLQSDIAEYGLMSYETANSYAGGTLTMEWYTASGAKYMSIVIGKGLYSLDEAIELYNSVQDTDNQVQPTPMMTKAPFMAANAPATTGNSSDTEITLDKFDPNSFYVGYGTKIYGNTVGSKVENVYLPCVEIGNLQKGNYISLYNCDTNTTVGVTLAGGTGRFTVNAGNTDTAYFFSDNDAYGVKYNENEYLELAIIPNAVKDATYTASLTLGENIDVNFKMGNIIGYVDGKLSITVDGSPVSFDFKDGIASCVLKAVEPKDIGKAIHVVATYDSVVVKSFDYSVKAYCNAVFKAYANDNTKYAKLNAICESILNYGKYAEDYANGNTESTVNAGYENDFSNVTLPTSKKVFTANATYGAGGSGAYLTLGSTIKLNYLVKTSYAYDNATTATQNFFILNEKNEQIDPQNVTVTSTDGGYIISIDLYAYQLANEYTLKVRDVDLTTFCIAYGVYDYCTEIQPMTGEKYTDTLKNLCKAIYVYGEAVQDYIKG